MKTELHARLCPVNLHTTQRQAVRLILEKLKAEISHHPTLDQRFVCMVEVRKDNGVQKAVGYVPITDEDVDRCRNKSDLEAMVESCIGRAGDKADEVIVGMLKRREAKP